MIIPAIGTVQWPSRNLRSPKGGRVGQRNDGCPYPRSEFGERRSEYHVESGALGFMLVHGAAPETFVNNFSRSEYDSLADHVLPGRRKRLHRVGLPVSENGGLLASLTSVMTDTRDVYSQFVRSGSAMSVRKASLSSLEAFMKLSIASLAFTMSAITSWRLNRALES